MKGTYALFGARLSALAGLVVSALLLYDYALPANNTLCGPGGGCASVRACWERVAPGVSLPWIGLGAFGLALALLLVLDEARGRKWLVPLGISSALSGSVLLVTQSVLCHSFCKFCIASDSSAILLGVFAYLARNEYAPAGPNQRLGFGSVAALVALGTIGLRPDPVLPGAEPPTPVTRMDHLPPPIDREQRPGVATIVEFADFECPYCRRQHETLTTTLASYGSRVRFVRKHVPLSMHPHAEGAARAACCAEEQGRGEQMADALFRSDDLTPEGCEGHARTLGIEIPRYRACLQSERTTSRLHTDRTSAQESGVSGLPTMFVGRERFEGVVAAEQLRASVDRALRDEASPRSSDGG